MTGQPLLGFSSSASHPSEQRRQRRRDGGVTVLRTQSDASFGIRNQQDSIFILGQISRSLDAPPAPPRSQSSCSAGRVAVRAHAGGRAAPRGLLPAHGWTSGGEIKELREGTGGRRVEGRFEDRALVVKVDVVEPI
jgi:hypothetical protein